MPRSRSVAPYYWWSIAAIDRQRCTLGLSSHEVEELCGLPLGSYQKLVHADSESGRCGDWWTISKLVAILFPDCDRIRFVRDGWRLAPSPVTRDQSRRPFRWLAHLAFISRNRTSEQLSAGRLKIPRERRREIARIAVQAREQQRQAVRESAQRRAAMANLSLHPYHDEDKKFP
jgi:hypothetical protein